MIGRVLQLCACSIHDIHKTDDLFSYVVRLIGFLIWWSQDNVRDLSLRIIGCGFTLEHVAFQRLGVVSSCLGENLHEQTYTFGYGRALPSGCDVNEVRECQLELSNHI